MEATVKPRKASRDWLRVAGCELRGGLCTAGVMVSRAALSQLGTRNSQLRGQRPIRLEVPQCCLLLPSPLVDAGEVVVRVGVVGIDGQRALVRLDRFVD